MSATIFDEAELLERLGDDAELVAEVIAVFLDDGPARLQAINDAVAHQSATELREAAHALKGAAGSISALRLFEAAQVLEQLAKAAPGVEPCDEAIRSVSAEMSSLLGLLASGRAA